MSIYEQAVETEEELKNLFLKSQEEAAEEEEALRKSFTDSLN